MPTRARTPTTGANHLKITVRARAIMCVLRSARPRCGHAVSLLNSTSFRCLGRTSTSNFQPAAQVRFVARVERTWRRYGATATASTGKNLPNRAFGFLRGGVIGNDARAARVCFGPRRFTTYGETLGSVFGSAVMRQVGWPK